MPNFIYYHGITVTFVENAEIYCNQEDLFQSLDLAWVDIHHETMREDSALEWMKKNVISFSRPS